MEYCLLLGGGEGCLDSIFAFAFVSFFFLLTVARSGVLDFQQHPHRTSSLLHGTFTWIRGVVTRTHSLVCPALWTGLITERAASPTHPSVPQTLLPGAALDVLTRLGLWRGERNRRGGNL